MAFDIRPVKDLDEFATAFFAIGQYFGAVLTEERTQRWVDQMSLERMHGAWTDGTIASESTGLTRTAATFWVIND